MKNFIHFVEHFEARKYSIEKYQAANSRVVNVLVSCVFTRPVATQNFFLGGCANGFRPISELSMPLSAHLATFAIRSLPEDSLMTWQTQFCIIIF